MLSRLLMTLLLIGASLANNITLVAIQMVLLREGGLAVLLNWYKIVTSTIERDDDQGIPKDNAVIQKPVFYGGHQSKFFVTSIGVSIRHKHK
ncbi:hypothetical protein VKT23_012606 [Stygiomarasmius scandens]|uniref:Secreted protein n=1 Tax=Marasmiellus scandens TaxID=2682957 RepID=A0ABR1JB19_9AGAR